MKLRSGVAAVLCLALWAGLAGTLGVHVARAQDAQQGASEDAAESRSATFQAVEGKTEKDVPGYPLMIGAYGFILVLLVAYVARLGALNAKNRVELDRLSSAIERARKA